MAWAKSQALSTAPQADTETGAQALAADPGQSVWVSANAGTGKTRVLIDRITRLLLTGTRPERILCLTFTKAAAAEMANRLHDRLGDWAASETNVLDDKLRALLGRQATNDERARAGRLFAETMDAPDGLKIRTIHAFCESLLGRFPLEANVVPNFQVIDERHAAELRLETRDALLHRSLKRDSNVLARAMVHLAGLVDENGFASVMTEMDATRGRLNALISEHGDLNMVIAAGRQALGLGPEETESDVINAAIHKDAFNAVALTDSCRTLAEGSPKDQERAGVLSAWLAADPPTRAALLVDESLPVFLTQKRKPRAATGLITKKQANANPSALNALLVEQARIHVVSENLKAVAVANNTAAVLTIGHALLDSYDQLKNVRGLLDYDDLITRAAALLSDQSGVSWVHYKLDGGINHILLDEAQDTSPAQWQVIAQLAGDFFTGSSRMDSDSGAPGRTVFAVGDEKQSIYSFQGADPSRFGIMGEQFAAKVSAAKQNWRRVEMAQSWRSTPAVLNIVDHVFEIPEAADGLTWTDHAIRHLTARQGHAGKVELWPLFRPTEAEASDPWDAPVDQISGDDPRIRLADTIATTVRDWIDCRENLESQGRPVVAGDIMILVRTRGTFADEMVRALKDQGVPVAGSDRMILTEHLAVMDLIALGRFALLPDDDLNTATVLKGPFVGLSENQLFDLAHGRNGTLWRELTRREDTDLIYGPALESLRRVLAMADYMPPFEFFNAQLFGGGRRAMLARMGPEAADPIDEFMALSLDFERNHVPSMEGFLHWIGTGQTEVKRDLEQAGGAVRVMTVHGAKGLQAPIVFLTDNGRLPARQLQDRLRWATTDAGEDVVLWPAFRDNEVAITEMAAKDSRLETEREYRRLLYVAMTRAEDRLYLTGWRGKRDPDAMCWHALVEAGLRRAPDMIEFDMPDGRGLRLCNPQTVPPAANQTVSPLRDGATELPSWARRDAPKEPIRSRPLSPSRQENDPTVASPLSDDGNRFKRGRILHALLQTLPSLPPNARPAALAAYLAEPAHNLSAAQQSELGGEVLAVLHHPNFAPLFGPGSRAEVPLVGDVGTLKPRVISGQVDRLLVSEATVTIVDFKTNRPPPKDETGVPEVYLRQMAAYRAALRQIYPDHEIISVLLWTDGPQLMRLSDTILDTHTP